MITWMSSHRRLQTKLLETTAERDEAVRKLTALLAEWNALVKIINRRGGQQFLQYGRVYPAAPKQLSSDDIKRLLVLVHPDKHDGKKLAVEMTQRLLSLR